MCQISTEPGSNANQGYKVECVHYVPVLSFIVFRADDSYGTVYIPYVYS